MEEILLNIDSKYRDINLYPNESKFTYNLDKIIKNVVAAKMISMEISNTTNYVDNKKNNNYFTLYLPNKTNDPDGIKLQLGSGIYQGIKSVVDGINILFNNSVNSNKALHNSFAEKYCYFFYLNSDLTLNFDFNSINTPVSLTKQLTIKAGWNSLYGIVLQITNYIQSKYNDRASYLIKNPNSTPIYLDYGNFILNEFYINVYDRRFRNVNTAMDCIRLDNVPVIYANNNNLNNNLLFLKDLIYRVYIRDTTNFVPSQVFVEGNGILDNLNCNNYAIPASYMSYGQNLNSSSIYYINNNNTIPSKSSIQTYNLNISYNTDNLLVSIINLLTQSNYYYYYVNDSIQTWANDNNTINNLTDKDYLYIQSFITQAEYNNSAFIPNLNKDIPQFEIDFYTVSSFNSLLDNNKVSYPSLGYYLGYRPVNSSYLLSSILINNNSVGIVATKCFNVNGNSYIFLRINDWGYIDLFNQNFFSKVQLTSSYGNTTLGYGSYILSDIYVNNNYVFRQPQNIKKMDIELVDYLGNTLDLNGVDFSITLQLCQTFNTDQKATIEKQSLVFIPK